MAELTQTTLDYPLYLPFSTPNDSHPNPYQGVKHQSSAWSPSYCHTESDPRPSLQVSLLQFATHHSPYTHTLGP